MFAAALEQARLILEDVQVLFDETMSLEETAWCWNVDMSNVWENILVQGYTNCLDLTVTHYDKWLDDKEQIENDVYTSRISSPFTHTESMALIRRPDILLTYNDSNWIIDAKYSFYKTLPRNVGRDYQNQMFGYAYLTKAGTKPWCNQLALIYTTDAISIPVEHALSFPLQGSWHHDWGAIPRLHQFLVSFPTREHVQSLETWHTYVDQVLVEQLSNYLQ